MFERDYIMRMIMQLVNVIRKSLLKEYGDPQEEVQDLERAIGNAVDMDPQLLLSLAPESIVSVLELGAFDEELGGYVVRALYYEAELLDKLGQTTCADLRRSQADAIAKRYAVDVDIRTASPEMLEEFFTEKEVSYGSD